MPFCLNLEFPWKYKSGASALLRFEFNLASKVPRPWFLMCAAKINQWFFLLQQGYICLLMVWHSLRHRRPLRKHHGDYFWSAKAVHLDSPGKAGSVNLESWIWTRALKNLEFPGQAQAGNLEFWLKLKLYTYIWSSGPSWICKPQILC